ncbi:endolytic transglycosylase MltG [Candidatus Parcubacteria bacterium]|nr:endolytic transglycosylase MltG [Candidatus Parcubacteria bacterium]
MIRNKKIAIAGGIILVIGIFIGAYQCLFSAPEKEFEMERIVINLGTTEEELIPKLKEQGYIRSEWAFKFVLKRKDWQGKIKPGGYKVSKNMNVWMLAETFIRFRDQNWIVIPEGLRKEEIAEIAKKELGWIDNTKEEFLNYAKEGYLFPDTYLLDVFNIRDAGKKVAKRMENNFNEKCQEIFKEFEEANIRNDTAITLASIIQREAANKEQMPLIAGIIWNRLLKPMPLQVDATIQYIVGEPGNWWRPVTPEEYKIESLYNTYLHEGRPPAPICNPGLAAIEAVVYDQPSDYFYYLHDSKGEIHLAKTYKEHKANIEQYLLEIIIGTITDVALSAKVITIQNQEGKEISLAITDETKLFLNSLGERVEVKLKDFQQGMEIRSAGRWTGKNTFLPKMIQIQVNASIELPTEPPEIIFVP